MLKIIIDTNVIISALISQSYPFKIINDFVFNERVLVCLSSDILEEYLNVLSRDKFQKYNKFYENSILLLKYLYKYSDLHIPNTKIDILEDKSDNKFLDLAFVSNADYIITGNYNDFTIDKFRNTKIISVKDFCLLFK